jgi:hypothetical protein
MNRKIFGASKDVILIGIGLVLLAFILRELGTVFTSGPLSGIISTVAGVYGILVFVIFLGLYAWAGMRAGREYGMNLVDSGMVAAFSYLITALVDYMLGIVGLVMFWCKAGVTCQQPVVGAAFGIMMAGVSGALATIVIAAVIFCGILVNFVVGAGGAALIDTLCKKKRK